MKITKLLLCFLVSSLCFSANTKTFYFKKPFHQTKNIFQKKISIYYKNNTLFIKGLNGNGNLKIYSIIGNIISDVNLQDLSDISLPIELIKQNMYIIRVETSENTIFTHKIVAR